MKRFLLLFTLLSIALGSFAQETDQALRNKANKKAKEKVSNITKKMILNPSDITFLENTFTTKYLYVYTYTKGKDVTPEYKEAIKNKVSEWFDLELDKQFSKEEKKNIKKYMRNKKKKQNE